MNPITYAAGAVGLVLLTVIGVLAWQNSHLQDRAIAAEATAAAAVAANKSWEEQADRINGTINALKASQDASAVSIAAELEKVNKNAGWLVNTAKTVANRPLPASPSQDCKALADELREFLIERRKK